MAVLLPTTMISALAMRDIAVQIEIDADSAVGDTQVMLVAMECQNDCVAWLLQVRLL